MDGWVNDQGEIVEAPVTEHVVKDQIFEGKSADDVPMPTGLVVSAPFPAPLLAPADSARCPPVASTVFVTTSERTASRTHHRRQRRVVRRRYSPLLWPELGKFSRIFSVCAVATILVCVAIL
jgi:hypothetical protein